MKYLLTPSNPLAYAMIHAHFLMDMGYEIPVIISRLNQAMRVDEEVILQALEELKEYDPKHIRSLYRQHVKYAVVAYDSRGYLLCAVSVHRTVEDAQTFIDAQSRESTIKWHIQPVWS